MRPPSVLLVSYHFHPSSEIGARRPTALAQFLVAKGLGVTVVSAFGERDIEPGSEVLPGVVAVPVRKPSRTFTGIVVSLKRKLLRARMGSEGQPDRDPGPLSGSESLASLLSRIRALYFRMAHFLDDYKRWSLRARRAAIREGKRRRPSLVLSSSPPLSVLWAGTLIARSLRVPHVVDLRDPWSDAVADSHPTWLLDLALQRQIERWMMRSAAAVTSTSATVTRLLIGRQPELAPKIFVVRNGFDGVVREARRDTGGRLAIFFAGNLYMNRDPLPVLQAIERLSSRPDVDMSRVEITFIGRRIEQIERSLINWLATSRCASIVKFVPPQPAEVVVAWTARATVLLNLAQHQPMSIPAKTFEHVASGRENLLLCEDDSETAQLVANIPGVIQVDPRNAAALDQALFDLYNRHVNQGCLRAPVEQDVSAFSRDAANETFWRIIQSVAGLEARGVGKGVSC